MNKKLISVIVPVYNAEKYIEKCIASLLAQTYQNIEIILINDGSTDKTAKILSNFENEPQLRIFHQENKGVSATRNRALEICTGDFITFVDADDFIESTYCELLYENLIKNNADISICNYYRIENEVVIKKKGTNKQYTANQALISIFEGKEEITGFLWCKFFKKECFKNIKFPEDKTSFEDYAVLYKIIANCNKITICDTPLYYYIYNENSLTSVMDAKKSYDFIDVIAQMYHFAEKYKNEIPNWNLVTEKTAFQFQFALKRYFIHLKKENNAQTIHIHSVIDDFCKREQISIFKYWKLLLFVYFPKLYNLYITLKKYKK